MFVQKLISETGNSTLSALHLGNIFLGFIIEDGHRNVKVYGETRIPAGTYKIVRRKFGGHYEKYKQRFGHQFSIELADVPGFTDILIHIGNYVKDTEGCLLINFQAGIDLEKGVFRGYQSTAAYKALYDLIRRLHEEAPDMELTYTIDRTPVFSDEQNYIL